ncbi:hypothetical protein PENTCL1PPCAC_12632 [Pristionchus entomophagus]|uniref:EF-hand domain-containing protein n=1 Tax=Pristionchus entomophagus TaxID=358040 RepID=A0AAV5T661_9BILA|nr:hypothetical protein PENTCL1PPCAC_12632 [Pristionchus entomophagus]
MFSLLLLSLLSISICAPITPLTENSLVPGLDLPKESDKERFERIDQNEDDDISFDEFLHMDYVYEQAKKEEFNLLDTDKDGKISKEEYDARLNQQQSRREEVKNSYFSGIFEEFDEDGDKSLSEEELRNVFHKRFLLEPRDNFGTIIEGFDVDQSGGLDVNEYSKLDKIPL